MGTFDLIADLPVRIESYELEGRERAQELFTRVSTTFHLHGGGETGLGEDVTYDEDNQRAQLEAGPVLDLAGHWTIREFSTHVGSLDLFPTLPANAPAYLDYRRWAIESAALDLALRQAGKPLHEVLGREPRPLSFVVSLRLGNPPSSHPVDQLLERYPGTRFKIDGTPDWSDELIEHLVGTGAVDAIDFKGLYRGTPVDVQTDAGFYRRIAEAFPDAKLEDPDLEPEDARAALEPHCHRITWDAPIHSVQDIQDRLWEVRSINVKPSRSGSIERLFEIYDYCAERGIACYSGGQAELSVGRGHAQLLSSIFHPDGPNDIAPIGYDQPALPAGLEPNPLEPKPEPVGFRRRVD